MRSVCIGTVAINVFDIFLQSKFCSTYSFGKGKYTTLHFSLVFLCNGKREIIIIREYRTTDFFLLVTPYFLSLDVCSGEWESSSLELVPGSFQITCQHQQCVKDRIRVSSSVNDLFLIVGKVVLRKRCLGEFGLLTAMVGEQNHGVCIPHVLNMFVVRVEVVLGSGDERGPCDVDGGGAEDEASGFGGAVLGDPWSCAPTEEELETQFSNHETHELQLLSLFNINRYVLSTLYL